MFFLAHYFKINGIYSQLCMDKERHASKSILYIVHCALDIVKNSAGLLAWLRERSLRQMGGLEI